METVRQLVAGSPQRATVRLSTADSRAIAFLEKHAEVIDRRYSDCTVEMDVVAGSSILARLRDRFPSSQILQCA